MLHPLQGDLGGNNGQPNQGGALLEFDWPSRACAPGTRTNSRQRAMAREISGSSPCFAHSNLRERSMVPPLGKLSNGPLNTSFCGCQWSRNSSICAFAEARTRALFCHRNSPAIDGTQATPSAANVSRSDSPELPRPSILEMPSPCCCAARNFSNDNPPCAGMSVDLE